MIEFKILQYAHRNKLRLAIYMCDNCSHTNLEYDKKELYKYFDNLLKQINIE